MCKQVYVAYLTVQGNCLRIGHTKDKAAKFSADCSALLDRWKDFLFEENKAALKALRAIIGIGVSLDSLQATLDRCRLAIKAIEVDDAAAATTSTKAKWKQQKGLHCQWSSIRTMLQLLSEMHLESHPAWTGYRAFPEPQQRWRCSTSSTELKLDVRFGPL